MDGGKRGYELKLRLNLLLDGCGTN